jgi:hypothetical protein
MLVYVSVCVRVYIYIYIYKEGNLNILSKIGAFWVRLEMLGIMKTLVLHVFPNTTCISTSHAPHILRNEKVYLNLLKYYYMGQV